MEHQNNLPELHQNNGRMSPHSVLDSHILSNLDYFVDSDDESDDDGEYIWQDLYRLWQIRRLATDPQASNTSSHSDTAEEIETST